MILESPIRDLYQNSITFPTQISVINSNVGIERIIPTYSNNRPFRKSIPFKIAL